MFYGVLQVEVPVRDDRKRTLLRPLRFLSRELGWVEVPAGFRTDYASVPRALWGLLPPAGPYTYAAVVHDYLYATGGTTRAQADAAFLEAMEGLGVARALRLALYTGVRAGGWVAWGKYRRVKTAG